MRTYGRLVAAAPALVGDALAGPAHTVPVLHRGIDALYLDLRGYPAPLPRPDLAVLGVLSASATAVPCGLQTTLSHLPPDVIGATDVVLGGGQLLLRDARETTVVMTRTVDAGVPHLSSAALRRSTPLLEGLVAEPVAAVRRELPESALADLAAESPDCVPALVGRGSGLTPVGDDVLCGWLAIQHARRGAGVRHSPIADAVREHAPGATTALSATLLGCAARGEVLPQFRRLVLTLLDPALASPHDHPTPHLGPSVDALLRVGHTSGAGLLLGATIALQHLASRSVTR